MTLEYFLRLWPVAYGIGGIAVAALLWRMRGEFATKTDLSAAREEITAAGHSVDAMGQRIDRVERDMRHLPTREDIHNLHIEVTKMRGEMSEMRAEARGLRDIMERTEAVLIRHEDIIATAAAVRSGTAITGRGKA